MYYLSKETQLAYAFEILQTFIIFMSSHPFQYISPKPVKVTYQVKNNAQIKNFEGTFLFVCQKLIEFLMYQLG